MVPTVLTSALLKPNCFWFGVVALPCMYYLFNIAGWHRYVAGNRCDMLVGQRFTDNEDSETMDCSNMTGKTLHLCSDTKTSDFMKMKREC